MIKSTCIKHCKENHWITSLPNAVEFDWLKEQSISEGFFQTPKGPSEAGKLKDVCRSDFFVDGYFDFQEKFWKSSSGIINESRWHVSSDFDWRTYPVLLDRVAYIKNWFPKFRRKYMVH